MKATRPLMPCPFCGSRRVGVFFSKTTFVDCRDCGARGPQIGEHMDKQTTDLGAQMASEKWNQRGAPALQQ